ncbi:MAG: hypothetical protein B7X81_03205 [Hydrogenophilales bacterium 17-61-76]|nr:MAG: hypothetical protein B7X81_03205 [Hydrogenophilales bacterium 17-61-76]
MSAQHEIELPFEQASSASGETLARDPVRRRLHLTLAFGIAILIATLVASYMQASAGLEALSRVALTNLHTDHVDQLRLHMAQAQSISRGYAITRDLEYLDRFNKTVRVIHEDIKAISADIKDEIAIDHLVKTALESVAHMEIQIRRATRGETREKHSVLQSSRIMARYAAEHQAVKRTLTMRHMLDVRQSVTSFRQTQIVTVVLAVAALVLLLLAITENQKQYTLRQKINQMLVAEKDHLERMVRDRTAELTTLASYLTEVRETEKLHLARELHDELGALLTAAKLDSDWIERKLPEETRALVAHRLARLRQSLASGIALKRRITNDLRPALLFDLGLIEALRVLAGEFNQGDELILNLDLPDDETPFAENVALSMFRIVQEALTNIRKYAQAKRVDITLQIQAGIIDLTIADDGVGFDTAQLKLGRQGLAGIKQRVLAHGGMLTIQSSAAGTTLHVQVPLVLPALAWA